MIELSSFVILDGDRRIGLVVGRGFDLRRQSPVYDVRFPGDEIMRNVSPERLRVAGPGRSDVIGRDIPHNPERAHFLEIANRSKAA